MDASVSVRNLSCLARRARGPWLQVRPTRRPGQLLQLRRVREPLRHAATIAAALDAEKTAARAVGRRGSAE